MESGLNYVANCRCVFVVSEILRANGMPNVSPVLVNASYVNSLHLSCRSFGV